jgi:CheY-like chemotaxis protein
MRGRIFEPFFTTKDVGQGTGLGLSISHGIASAHGGALNLCPNHAAGACFRLTLPAHVEAAPQPSVASLSGAPSRRVLVVDDEASIRKLLVRLLERRGFEVLEAETAPAAMAIADRTALALVLCDVRMPGSNGMEFYRTLVARRPQLKDAFVFITGDRSALDIEAALRHVPVLTKPFTATDLQAVLAAVGLQEVVV